MIVLAKLRRRGINARIRGNDLVLTPASAINDEIRYLVRNNKAALKAELFGIVSTKPIVEFSWHEEDVAVQLFKPGAATGLGGLVCLDCETTLIEGGKIPSLVMLAASDGYRHFVVQAKDLAEFVQQHSDRHVVFHNAAFDFWVIGRWLNKLKALSVRRDWDRMLKRDQFHDTMLLDRLLRIAGADPNTGVGPRNLAKVSAHYAKLELSKDDPYRKRFGDIQGECLTTVDPGFVEYAIKDTIAAVRSYIEMHAVAMQIMVGAGFKRSGNAQETYSIRPDAVSNFGLLTEAVQVKSSIAFSLVTRNGLTTSKEKRLQLKAKVRGNLKLIIDKINEGYPEVFRKNGAGNYVLTQQGQQPSENRMEIRKALAEAYIYHFATEDGIPVDKDGQTSIKRDDWSHLLGRVEFAQEWFDYKAHCKVSQAIPSLDEDRLHPKYDILKVTGRTGCSKPNMQNIPRGEEFRQIIVPSQGKLLLAVDYSFIELVTLAATCKCRYGFSNLGDLIAAKKDPHCFTASMLLDMGLDEFMLLKASAPGQFKLWRQRAKPINFGVPGGMTAKSLVSYAKSQYGVDFSVEEAQKFSDTLTQDAYPELSRYLGGDEMEVLAKNLSCSPDEVWSSLDFTGNKPSWLVGAVKKVVAGTPNKVTGEPYSERFVKGIWDGLCLLNKNPSLGSYFRHRIGSKELSRLIFNSSAVTTTGRVRSPVSYTTKRNTPFQGLAADGAKIAVSDLIFSGYRVVGFVHDEILVELPDEGGFVCKTTFDKVISIVRRGMEKVTSGVPVQCEATLSTCWSKRAQLIEDGSKIVAWRPDN